MLKLCQKPIFLALFILIISLPKSSTKSQPSSNDHQRSLTLELYMHDVLGGNRPTAKPVTGFLGAIYNRQVAFAKPISTPSVTGLAGTTPPDRIQRGTDGLSLGFGTVTVIDDAVTVGPTVGSQAVGRARGVHVATGVVTWSVMVALTVVMEGGEYGDSVSLCGVYLGGSQTTSKLAVVGGTGKYKGVGGFAEVRSLVSLTGQRDETLLRLRIHLRF